MNRMPLRVVVSARRPQGGVERPADEFHHRQARGGSLRIVEDREGPTRRHRVVPVPKRNPVDSQSGRVVLRDYHVDRSRRAHGVGSTSPGGLRHAREGGIHQGHVARRRGCRDRSGSVDQPDEPRPLLRVRVAQPTPTSIELRFDIAYAAASGALLSTDDGLPLPRERQREQRLLEGLDLLDEVPGARARRGTSYAGYWDVAHRLVLQGMPAVHFISSVLPALDSHPDVRVVIDGELTAYEEASEAPVIDIGLSDSCLLYTSDAADERSSVDLGGRRIIKKKKKWAYSS